MRSLPVALLAVAALGLLVNAGSTVAEQDEPAAALYLAHDGTAIHNFTTEAPTAEEPTPIEPFSVSPTGARWLWTGNVSAFWTLPADSTIEVELYMDRLDRVVPVAHPVRDADGVLRHKVTVYLMHGQLEMDWPAGATAIEADLVQPESGVQRFQLSVTTDRDLTWDPDAETPLAFSIAINLTGNMRPNDPARLLIGASATPSHLQVPNFPIAAFRAAEQAKRDAEACSRVILEGGTCEEPEDDPGETKGAPGAAVPAVVVAAALGSAWTRRRYAPGRSTSLV